MIKISGIFLFNKDYLVMNNKLYTPTFFLILLMNFIFVTGFSMFVIYPLHLVNISKTKAEIGFIIGIMSVSSLVSRFIIGHFLDRIGRRFFVRLGAGMVILCSLLYTLPFHDNWYLIIIRLLHGFASGFYFTAVFTLVTDYTPPNRLAEAIGVFGISGFITLTTSTALSEFILRTTNGSFIFVFLSAVLFCILGILLSFRVNEVYKPGIGVRRECFSELLKRWDVILVVLTGLLYGFGMSGVFVFATPFVKNNLVGNVTSFFIPFTVGSIIVRLFLAKLADLNRNYFLVPGFLMLAGSHIFLGHLTSIYYVGVVGFLAGMSSGMAFPAVYAAMLDRAGPENRGRGMGLIDASNDLGFLVGAVTLGYIAEQVGYMKMYNISGIVLVLGLSLFFAGSIILKLHQTNKLALNFRK
jgi:MFS family permease